MNALAWLVLDFREQESAHSTPSSDVAAGEVPGRLRGNHGAILHGMRHH
jgi:hypothetical protein